MSSQRAFGIGCFHFGYNPGLPLKYTTSEYIEALKFSLNSLSSVSQLEIDYYDKFEESYELSGAPPSLFDGEFFPYVEFLTINFKLYIPRRVQAEVISESEDYLRSGAEHFNVRIVNHYYGPLAFIECLDAKKSFPSGAVRVLREFLKREFKKISNGITFESLGPSPFHGDFYVRCSAEVDGGVSLEIDVVKGYDVFVFTVSNGKSHPDNTDMDTVYGLIDDEISLFYELQRARVRLMRGWQKITETWTSLKEKTDAEFSISRVFDRFKVHSTSKQLISDAYSFRVECELQQQQIEAQLKFTYGKGVSRYLESYLLDRSEQVPDYPIESILNWAQHVNQASFKAAEIIAVMSSAVFGGVVGAVLTKALAG
ncbi:hypothetical protein [Pseudomonas chlororaphis]